MRAKTKIVSVAFGAIIIAIVANFAAFHKMVSDFMLNLNRETASVRVEKAIAKMRADIESLDKKALKDTTDARAIESSLEREQKELDKIKEAIKKLSATAKDAGLPKPSRIATLTAEQAATKLTFGRKCITGSDVYATLERWVSDFEKRSNAAQMKTDAVERMRSIAKQIETKKSEMADALAKMEGRIKELEASKDVAKLNAELAEMEACVQGVNVGESGKALQVIDEHIDELNAVADTYREAALTKQSMLNPKDVLTPSSSTNKLDAFWDVF